MHRRRVFTARFLQKKFMLCLLIPGASRSQPSSLAAERRLSRQGLLRGAAAIAASGGHLGLASPALATGREQARRSSTTASAPLAGALIYETSAKSNTGVSQLFHDVARRLVSTKSRSADASATAGLPPLPDPLNPDAGRRSGKCCS